MLFFTLLSLLFLPILSLKEIKPKLCINCKYFIPNKVDNKFGRCSKFPEKEKENIYRLVNGFKEDTPIQYHFCSTLRSISDFCGEEGKMYKKKYIKKIKSKMEE